MLLAFGVRVYVCVDDIVNNHPLTKNKPIYHARISKQVKLRGSPEPFHLFTFRA